MSMLVSSAHETIDIDRYREIPERSYYSMNKSWHKKTDEIAQRI